MATREQGQRRRVRIRASGPAEFYTRTEIGERDGWVCGVCCDLVRLVELPPELVKLDLEMLVAEDVPPGELVEEDPGYRRRRRPLSASIDHVVPVRAGGADSRGNVQIAHLFCNLAKNGSNGGDAFTRPEYVRASLTNLIDGTPIPEDVQPRMLPIVGLPSQTTGRVDDRAPDRCRDHCRRSPLR
jgi:HNH endonuclease